MPYGDIPMRVLIAVVIGFCSLPVSLPAAWRPGIQPCVMHWIKWWLATESGVTLELAVPTGTAGESTGTLNGLVKNDRIARCAFRFQGIRQRQVPLTDS